MRTLVCFDKFKGAITAQVACETARRALAGRIRGAEIHCCPLTDGGDGFVRTLSERIPDSQWIPREVSGPRGQRVRSGFALVPLSRIPPGAQQQLQLPSSLPGAAPIALTEMASASGLSLLAAADRDPWKSSSLGTGELIDAAWRHGACAIVLGVGGSATNDLGTGALSALGLRFLDADRRIVETPTPENWVRIEKIDGRIPDALPPIRIACDVVNPLLGPRGAAATYGPQKGLRPTDIPLIETQSARIARLLCDRARQPFSATESAGTGAAGGIAFGLMVAARARLIPGFDFVSAWFSLDDQIRQADLVITGEGAFDESSFQGKGPGAVVRQALALDKPVHVFAGKISPRLPSSPVLRLHPISPPDLPLSEALEKTPALLAEAIRSAFLGHFPKNG